MNFERSEMKTTLQSGREMIIFCHDDLKERNYDNRFMKCLHAPQNPGILIKTFSKRASKHGAKH